MWGSRKFELAEFQHAIDDLKATPFRRLTDRFLRVNVTPGNVDWFDDQAWAVVLHNFTVAAQIAKQGGCKGFMFDVEQYNEQLFNYGKQKHRETKTFDDYRAKVRQRGQEWMKAVNGQFPDITMLLTFGYSITGGAAEGPGRGLLRPVGRFSGRYAGCLHAADQDRGRLGRSLHLQEAGAVPQGVRDDQGEVGGVAADPEKYRRRVEAGFGIWMDCNWREVGWHVDDCLEELLHARRVRGICAVRPGGQRPVRVDLHRAARVVDQRQAAQGIRGSLEESSRTG